MIDMTDAELADLYPQGRTFYDETDDPAAFVKAMQEMGLTPQVTVQVPAEQLGAFYRLGLTVGT